MAKNKKTNKTSTMQANKSNSGNNKYLRYAFYTLVLIVIIALVGANDLNLKTSSDLLTAKGSDLFTDNFAKIPVKMSLGTSLLIIATNSFVGFIAEVMTKHETIDYEFLTLFTLLSVTGIFIGFRLATIISSDQLKKLFGWFVIVTAVFVFTREVFWN